jgi:hypothetical protein
MDQELKMDQEAILQTKKIMTKPVIYGMLEELEKKGNLTKEEILFWHNEIPVIEADYDRQIAELKAKEDGKN